MVTLDDKSSVNRKFSEIDAAFWSKSIYLIELRATLIAFFAGLQKTLGGEQALRDKSDEFFSVTKQEIGRFILSQCISKRMP